jgi:DNA-binding transcriptional ArsR family regulator
MLSKHAWRMGVRREGHTYLGGNGMCSKHYRRMTRWGDTELRPRRGYNPAVARSRAEVLEDYRLIKDDVYSVGEAAARMGMSEAALTQALSRARRAGITDATPPISQALRRSA